MTCTPRTHRSQGMPGRIFVLLGITIAISSLFACAAMKEKFALSFQHPLVFEKVVPICTNCHAARTTEDVQYAFFNHTSFFVRNHRMEAYQGLKICLICHTQKNCNDCHGVGIELKPSQKNQIETFREMHHRGDYLSRHRIDGRIDPSSCFRCHGNSKTAKTCVKCHG